MTRHLSAVPAPDSPVDLSYVEPSGWVSPVDHCVDLAAAERLRRATDSLSGPDARQRRRWFVSPCTCPAGAR